MMMQKCAILLFTMAALAGCQEKKVDQQAEAEKLMELSREWAKAAVAGDADKTLSYWAPDAVVMSPGAPAMKGHEAIREMLNATSGIPGFEINWEPKEAYVSESGDLGYVLANNYVKMQDSLGNTITTYNKSVEIWKKQPDGSWKNVVDIFNEDPSLNGISGR